MKKTLSMRVKYRPIKIGWCVHDQSFQELEEVLRLSHTLWGGRYNPIIPISDHKQASILINTFRVDALYPAKDDDDIKEFIDKYPYLSWPLFHKQLFIGEGDEKVNTALDVQHPLRFIYEQRQKNLPVLRAAPTLFQWVEDDPLSRVLLATLGAYPPQDTTGHKYKSMYEKYLDPVTVSLNRDSPIPNDLHQRFLPNTLTSVLLNRDCGPNREEDGLYFGDVNCFEDVLNFWNLRASGVDLFFYDPTYGERLNGLKDEYCKDILARPSRFGDARWVSVWGRDHKVLEDISTHGLEGMKCAVNLNSGGGGVWNGLNIKPPIMHFDSKSCLATISESHDQPVVTFELPNKPFSHDIRLSQQHALASVWPITDISEGVDWTLQLPYIPELNEYYGRECYFDWNGARAEQDGVGFVIGIGSDIMTLRALRCREVISKMFHAFGMNATPSHPGLICHRLLQQMKGLQGCRVFKISGVRELIEKYGPDRSFTRSGAIQTIRQEDPQTKEIGFSKFENLFIERRETKKLVPEDALRYLVENEVFRVGLDLKCSKCELTFWKRLDDVKTSMSCEYCGNEFDITSQLRDRDWAYRRSGLFGRDDSQAGSIPVVLTLQQLDTLVSSHPAIYATSMNVEPTTADINKCETDFVLVTKAYSSKVQLVIGECKTRKEITEEDVINLTKMADAFPRERFEVFILFSKLDGFSDVEIKRCEKSQDPYRQRVIMLTNRELEPYFIYERTEKEFVIKKTAIGLDDLARNTVDIYFHPMPLNIS